MVYVDTSVIVAMLTNEPKTQTCIDWFSNLKQTPLSSDWLITEFNSAIAIKQRTNQLSTKDIKPILQQFNALLNGGIKLMPISRDAFSEAGKLIHKHANTRAGDALHLSVAIECAVKQFVTLDMAQAASAMQLGFEVVTMHT